MWAEKSYQSTDRLTPLWCDVRSALCGDAGLYRPMRSAHPTSGQHRLCLSRRKYLCPQLLRLTPHLHQQLHFIAGTPLHLAVQENREVVVQLLINYGTHLPFVFLLHTHLYIQCVSTSNVSHASAGANVNLRNARGRRAVDLASESLKPVIKGESRALLPFPLFLGAHTRAAARLVRRRREARLCSLRPLRRGSGQGARGHQGLLPHSGSRVPCPSL